MRILTSYCRCNWARVWMPNWYWWTFSHCTIHIDEHRTFPTWTTVQFVINVQCTSITNHHHHYEHSVEFILMNSSQWSSPWFTINNKHPPRPATDHKFSKQALVSSSMNIRAINITLFVQALRNMRALNAELGLPLHLHKFIFSPTLVIQTF